MPKNKIINIDLEFDSIEFNETDIKRATGYVVGSEKRKQQWKYDIERKSTASKRRQNLNLELYGKYDWIVCSPGNDLLDFYDEFNKSLGKDNRAYSAIPPSIVYHYRFEHEYPPELDDKSLNYGKGSYIRDRLKKYHNTNDPTYWGQVRKTRYSWLVNKPHKKFIFNYRKDVVEFFKKTFNQTSFNIDISVNNLQKHTKHKHLFLRGVAKGWSILVIPKK